MLADIAAYLVTQGVCTGINTDLFIAQVPESPDLCVMLFEYAGMPPDTTFDGTYDTRPSLQVRVRAGRNAYGAGIAKIKAIEAALHGLSNITLSGTLYKSIMAQASPGFIGRDTPEGRPEWTQNFNIIRGA